ncbi:hypothetical protein [Amycolatopsis sp. FDAARGOS 1241]|uniref:hypothetical protein n=1 Tax=Amycolatopsis sp. FDAARGOS 1241 TaxID=2778070 RepID=UPI0019509918|nr:hypothetical protein [Amycolatopsis sp. FDAARGOS 1241]QRP48869.1 hypothetical protein I6J71_14260 [Amycolatopsis sp. FDAARGOS 1241]
MSRAGWSKLALLVPGLLVALGAAAATAHGLFEVASASGVPAGIAWIYPLITDGLAIVAYASTSRLSDAGSRYAWAVVILAAGLSGVAQAVFLAGGFTATPTDGAPATPAPEVLRFGVGAWPAIAAAIVAHLLFMLATDHSSDAVDATDTAASGTVPAEADRLAASTPVVAPKPVQPSGVQSPSVQPGPVQPRELDAASRSASDGRTAAQPGSVQPEPSREPAAEEPKRERPVSTPSSPKRDRARAAARRHQATHGTLPTVDHLMEIADVSRGTAGTALQELREQPAPLQLITELSNTKANS